MSLTSEWLGESLSHCPTKRSLPLYAAQWYNLPAKDKRERERETESNRERKRERKGQRQREL